MTTLLLLTAEDINCRQNGDHWEVVTKEGTIINFTPEAIKELQKDLMHMVEKKPIQRPMPNYPRDYEVRG